MHQGVLTVPNETVSVVVGPDGRVDSNSRIVPTVTISAETAEHYDLASYLTQGWQSIFQIPHA
jgi:hypothetical protein